MSFESPVIDLATIEIQNHGGDNSPNCKRTHLFTAGDIPLLDSIIKDPDKKYFFEVGMESECSHLIIAEEGALGSFGVNLNHLHLVVLAPRGHISLAVGHRDVSDPPGVGALVVETWRHQPPSVVDPIHNERLRCCI